ncbi:endonuclease III domain-containing protein [Aspergillus brunneoviolaceus CBS 621.78]|uniref:DNA glycosylase n=1 Tax=Aspergillus brunneoviolaceus CBS 621.78 TaxID=1450534 RepID=A0ACD1GPC6_9EURO|nr:DNA glycosylase [Aspergillus brunneoviolaceus CBS 621.78]RAH51095.1 DNA glycosylase [Aspergillus brunneoviolaceus CBS 621.78]
MAPVLRRQAHRAGRSHSTTTTTTRAILRTSSASADQNPTAAQQRAQKKWNHFRRYASESPYPDFSEPSPEECYRVNRILTKLHGPRDPLSSEFPDVLHGLIYGVLCQATNERNAIRQVHGLDKVYGSWRNFSAIAEGGESKLRETLACGGLHERKSRMILKILQQELLSYYGVGPITASCVLALTLQRQRFVVDTHIYRLTGELGWRPSQASAEQARAHLEQRIPDGLKYSLHLLFISTWERMSTLSCRS